jgi:hypothetical protein
MSSPEQKVAASAARLSAASSMAWLASAKGEPASGGPGLIPNQSAEFRSTRAPKGERTLPAAEIRLANAELASSVERTG